MGEARGYNEQVDAKTLQQVMDCASQYKGGLKVKFNPSTFNHGDAGLAGFIPKASYRIEDNALLGDLHVYKSYPNRDYLFEVAETSPDHFGLSMDFLGVAEKIDGKNYSRCEEIFAATVVDLPAANPTGLFSAGNISKNGGSEVDKEEVKTIVTEALKPVLDSVKEFRTKFEDIGKQVSFKEPTKEEKEAAGCKEGDTPEEVTRKVTEYRSGLDKPVTQRDLMKFFRQTGGKPVVINLAKDETKNNDPIKGFKARVDTLKEAGCSQANAWSTAIRKFPDEYKAFRDAGKNKKAKPEENEE
jgi:hypothetical protein